MWRIGVCYPSGCQSVAFNLEDCELLKRLGKLAFKLRKMKAGSDLSGWYGPLALHLVNKNFLEHKNEEITCLLAECIAGLIRISSPSSPYERHPRQPEIFSFLIDQLRHLADLNSKFRDRCLLILASLVQVNAFASCIDSEMGRIFTQLFTSLFRVSERNDSEDFHVLAVKLMTSLLRESRELQDQLLDIILEGLVNNPRDTLARKVLGQLGTETSAHLAEHLLQILSNSSHLMSHSPNLVSKLIEIYPGFSGKIFPKLRDSMYSEVVEERKMAILVLSSILSTGELEPAFSAAFFRKFIDKNEEIRSFCVVRCREFLLGESHLRREMVKRLKIIQRDKSEDVRCHVVRTIIFAGKSRLKIFGEEPDLFDCILERSVDVSYRIRKTILKELTSLYREYSGREDLSREEEDVLVKILNTIISSYNLEEESDRFYMEKIMYNWLIEFRLPADRRMRKLFDLFRVMSVSARKAFVQMLLHQQAFRKLLTELLGLTEEFSDRSIFDKKLRALSMFFTEPVRAMENLRKFFDHLRMDRDLLGDMRRFVDPHVSCKLCETITRDIFKRIVEPDESDPYYQTLKALIDRASSVMIDEEAIIILLGYVDETLNDRSSEIITNRAFHLLEILSFVLPSHFAHDGIVNELAKWLELRCSEKTSRVMAIMSNIGRYAGEVGPGGRLDVDNFTEILEPFCKAFAKYGSPSQAKHAIRVICTFPSLRSREILVELLRTAGRSLTVSAADCRVSLATIGYIATYSPGVDLLGIKDLMRRMMRDIVIEDVGDVAADSGESWCLREDLPLPTICRLQAMKSATRSMLALKTPGSVKLFFELFDAIIRNRGDMHRRRRLSESEMSWMRLEAGACMLKLCKQDGLDDGMTAAQFYTLSRLMVDDVKEVRRAFADKLEMALDWRCSGLPMEFLGLYALGGLERNDELKERLAGQMMKHMRKRRAFIESPLVTGGGRGAEVWSNLLPECILIYAIPVLANYTGFSDPGSGEQVEMVRRCMEFILGDYFDGARVGEAEKAKYYSFFRRVIEKIGQCRDAERQDDEMQRKISGICGVARAVIDYKTSRREKSMSVMVESSFDPYVPRKYLVSDETLNASRYYLADEVIEGIRRMGVGERRKAAAAKRTERRVVNQTFGIDASYKRKGNAGRIAPETLEKRRKTT